MLMKPDELSSRRLNVDSIARAIWRQNVSLAKKLLKVSDLAKSFLVIRETSVACRDFAAFDDCFVQTRALQQQQRVASIEKSLSNTTSINKVTGGT